jgi:hypothetical protein
MFLESLRGLPPACILRRAASWRKYSGPRFALALHLWDLKELLA